MKSAIFAGATCILAALTAGCVEPPVKPIPEAARRSVTAASADVSGMKDSDTSKLGARGSDEGGKLGALQGAAVAANSGSLLGMLILMPVGAAVGGAKGAAEAQSAEVVDDTRSNLRLALQETDFTELLRQRLATSKAAGPIEFSAVTAGSASAPLATTAGTPVGHVIALEYRLNLYAEHLVNPLVGVYVRVTAQVQSPDRKQLLHNATWSYCSDRTNFVQAAANNAALFRAEINRAAAVLGEAIPYDLYTSRQPRPLKAKPIGVTSNTFIGCMDFSDLPSRTGEPPLVLASPTPVPLAAAAQTRTAPTPVTPTAVTPVAAAAPSASDFDGPWQMELLQLSTTYGTTVGGECPARHAAPVTFANGIAEGPWGKLSLNRSGEVSGWINVPSTAASMLPFIVNVSGRMENNVLKGTVSGRCTGTFVMSKQSPNAAAAPVRVASVAPSAPAPNAVDGAWLIEMQVSSTFCLSQSTAVTFANRAAEGPWGKLQVTPEGELGGWMKLKPLGTGSVDYLVNLSGRLENGSIGGTISGRCVGTFTMRKQS